MTMDIEIATTPFGRRLMTLALVQANRKPEREGRAVDKWKLYRDLCEAKTLFGLNDRALAVLSALLSFYPDDELSDENGLVVFPSNRQLSLRAHGMPGSSLRRHIAALMDAGLIVRRDSPNGKRYAHKTKSGEIEEAFGLSLAPLLARADEIAVAADNVRAELKLLKRTRERISLQRRDIAKLIDVAMEEGAEGDWSALYRRFRAVVDAIPRRATIIELRVILGDLEAIRSEVDKLLINLDNVQDVSANDHQIERQHTESNPESHSDFEPALKKAGGDIEHTQTPMKPVEGFPLGLILKACPEISDYAVDGIANWRDLITTSGQVRSYLGISPSAYDDAIDVMGPENAAVVIACILQRSSEIHSPGGYLRSLTTKGRAGELSIGSIVMACLKTSRSLVKDSGGFSASKRPQGARSARTTGQNRSQMIYIREAM